MHIPIVNTNALNTEKHNLCPVLLTQQTFCCGFMAVVTILLWLFSEESFFITKLIKFRESVEVKILSIQIYTYIPAYIYIYL